MNDNDIATRAREVRDAIVNDLEGKACYRESLIEKYPWHAGKNSSYAQSLRMTMDYVASLPDDNPTLQALACCKVMWPPWSGIFELPSGAEGMPSNTSNDAIHCGPRGKAINPAEIAAWFEGWAKIAMSEAQHEAEQNAEIWAEWENRQPA